MPPELLKASKYNPNHSENFKKEVVRYYLESNDTASDTAKKFKITPKTVANWVELYTENPGEVRQSKATKYQNSYSDEFKFEVIRHYLESDDGLTKTAKKFNLPCSKSVSNWLVKFGRNISDLNVKVITPEIEEPAIINNNPIGIVSPSVIITDDVEKLKGHIRQLEFRLLAANTMIDVAEREFSIPIRKKSGAKQSCR